MHRHIGFIGAVHTQHTKPLITGRWIAAKAHQCGGERETSQFSQLTKFRGCPIARVYNTTACIKDRLFSRRHCLNRSTDCMSIALHLRPIAFMITALAFCVEARRKLHIFWNIDNHWAWTTRCRNMKRFMQNTGQIIHVLHQPIVLGTRPRNANCVAFLERIIADEMSGHLACNTDERN